MIREKILKVSDFIHSLNIHQWLLITAGFSCFLLAIRVLVTGSLFYFFLPWNLVLAFIPYWITETKSLNLYSGFLNKAIVLIISGVWIMFIPNSFYIITDLFHLSRASAAPAWFDLALILSFAWAGILCGVISLSKMEIKLAGMISSSYSVLFVFLIMWLCAFGIYIGRYLRYNSWDILTDPFSLAQEILYMIGNPFQNKDAWGMTICYSVIMFLIYVTIKKMSENSVMRKAG